MAAPTGNTLALMDQGSLLWVQASGHVHCIQGTWVYNRAIDIDGLRRTRRNLAQGLLGRRVECSPLPFGRHRWVTDHRTPDIDIAPPVTAFAAVAEWADQRAQVPIDPVHGPCWHLGVLPIEGHGTAVTLVASHTVLDGVGLSGALADAHLDNVREPGYPSPGSRPRRRALAADAQVMAQGLPEIARAIVAGVKLARHQRRNRVGSSTTEPSGVAGDGPVAVPMVTAYIDLGDWDARAESLGGTSNSLFAAVATKLAERIGRVGAGDGRVTLTYPVSDRTENDTRGNALRSVDLTVDPATVTADLREVRTGIKRALTLELGNFSEQQLLLPLIPLVPKVVARKAPVDAAGAAALPVGCSYLGEIDPAVAYLDGTEADCFSMRMVVQNVTRQSPELKYGELHITAGRICGKLFIAVRSYRAGAPNVRRELAEVIARTLADFDLTGEIG